MYLHHRPWISLWIKSISNKLGITCHLFASQLSGHYDVIANRLWCHQQNIKWASETRDDVWRSLFSASFIYSLCHLRNKIMYVLLWWTVFALTRVLFWCLFPSLLCNSDIYIKITLSWAHKQFDTRVHTLFYIFLPPKECLTLPNEVDGCPIHIIHLLPIYFCTNSSWNVRAAICPEGRLSLLALSSVYSPTVEDGSWSTPMVPAQLYVPLQQVEE